MTEKPTEPAAAAPGSAAPETPRPVGEPVRSPFDSPTEQFNTATVKAELTKETPPANTEVLRKDAATEVLRKDETPRTDREVPRTDEELGLDPEVPLYAEMKEAITGASTAVPAPDSAPTYAFASIPPAPNGGTEPTTRIRRRGDERRGTLDLGLLLLRLVVGGTFIYHGLQKATGWFHGPGYDGIRTAMENGGWKHVDIAAPMLIAGELGGGILVVLGLATPLAAGAVLAVILDAWLWKQGMAPGFQYKADKNSVELESVLAGAAAAIILTGPGRLALDRGRGWATRPFLGSLAALIAAIAAAVLTYIYLHGGNPLEGVGPF